MKFHSGLSTVSTTHSNMTLSVMQGVRLCVSVVSGIELAGLFHAYQANLTRFPAASSIPVMTP